MTKLLVISDIHAFEPEPGRARFHEGDPSYARTVPDPFETSRGPFQSFCELIARENLVADYIVCCGDMGDKADQSGVTFSWSWLETVRRRMGNDPVLLATAGNHDVDSRNKSGRNDPEYILRSLQPPFPLDDDDLRAQYFTAGVTVLHDEVRDIDIVLLNTTALHDSEEHARRGLIGDATLTQLAAVVATCHASRRVLVAHHHPYRHEALDPTDDSALEAGPEVIKILQDSGDWLVIHGHRHYPNLVYAAGGSKAPVVMAAGSFAAVLYPELTTRVRNQVHLLDIEPTGHVNGTSGAIGKIRSWEYVVSSGWQTPISQEGIPDGAGFGYRAGVDGAKSAILNYLAENQSPFVTLETVEQARPELKYLLPVDRFAILHALEADGSVKISPSVNRFSAAASDIFLQGVTQ